VPLVHQVIAPVKLQKCWCCQIKDLSRIARKRTYIFPVTPCVSDYPFLRRDVFVDVSRRIRDDAYSSDDSVRQDQPRRRCTSVRNRATTQALQRRWQHHHCLAWTRQADSLGNRAAAEKSFHAPLLPNWACYFAPLLRTL